MAQYPVASPVLTASTVPVVTQPPTSLTTSTILPQPSLTKSQVPIASAFVVQHEQSVNATDDLTLSSTDYYDAKKFTDLLKELFRASSLQEYSMKKKTELLVQGTYNKRSQRLSTSLWTFTNSQKIARATCMCPAPVAYSYTEQIAVFDETKGNHFQNLVRTLHELNTNHLFLSQFEQTLAELDLALYVHTILKGNPTKDVLYSMMDSISLLLSTPETLKDVATEQTLGVLRGLYTMIGSHIVSMELTSNAMAASTSNQASLLDLSSDTETTLAQTMTLRIPEQLQAPSDSTSASFLLEKAIQVKSISWAGELLQPSIKDVISQQWIHKAVGDEKAAQTEPDYIRLLAQVPWKDITQLTVEQVKQLVLLPLQKLLHIAANKNMLGAMLLVGKIIAYISRVFPSLVLSCVGIITRSPWPSKMLNSTVLRLFSWDALTTRDLSVLFGELYQLFQLSPMDYSLLPPTQRVQHRSSFVNYLLTNQSVVSIAYNIDPTLATHNFNALFPLLYVLAEIALAFQKKFVASASSAPQTIDHPNLLDLITHELTYMAFSWQPVGQAVPQPALLPQFKLEATTALKAVCSVCPSASRIILDEIGNSLPGLSADEVVSFLRSIDTSEWAVDNRILGWISILLTHRRLPDLPQPSAPQFQTAIDNLVNLYLHSAEQVSFPPQIVQAAATIGATIVDCLQWSKVSPTTRAILVLILMAARPYVTISWRCNALRSILDANNRIDVDPVIAYRILNVKSSDDPFWAVAQCFIATSLSAAHFDSLEQGIPMSGEQRGVKWLLDSGIVRRLSAAAAYNEYHDIVCLAAMSLFTVIKIDPLKESFSHLQALVDTMQRTNLPSTRSWLAREVVNTLSDPRNYAPWVTFWAFLLIPKLDLRNAHLNAKFQPTAFDDALNEFVHGLFCGTTDFEELSHLVVNKTFTLRDVEQYLRAQLPWVVYLAICAFNPRIPPTIDPRMKEPDHTIKNSALWMWREAAMRIDNPRFAMVFWERFMLTYFECCAMHATKSYFPNTWKDSLNKHFVSLAQQFQTNVEDRPLYQAYYAFTTWSKEIVLGSGANIFHAGNSDILKQFIRYFPPKFPRTLADRSTTVITKQTVVYPSAGATSLSQSVPHRKPTNEIPKIDSKVTIEDLLAMFPAKLDPFEMPFYKQEMARFTSYNTELRKNFDRLSSQHGQDIIDIPAVEDLRVFLQQRDELAADLEKLDAEHWGIITKLYKNDPIIFKVKVACQLGEDCNGPVVFRINSTRILSSATAATDLKANRDAFSKVYYTLFSVARNIGHNISVLHSISSRLLCNENTTLARSLFFCIAEIIISGLVPPYTPHTTHLIQICMKLGRKYIARLPDECQMKLLRLILDKASHQNLTTIALPVEAAPTPSTDPLEKLLELTQGLTVSEPPNQTSDQIAHMESLEHHAGSVAGDGIVAQVMQVVKSSGGPALFGARTESTKAFVFNETRADLYTLLTPLTFVESGDILTYLDMLILLARSSSNLSIDEEKVLADRFQLPSALPSIIQSPYVERLFEIFELAAAKRSMNAICDALLPVLMRHAYPTNIAPVVRTILLQPRNNYSPNWEVLDADLLDETALSVVIDELPLPDAQLNLALQLTRRVVLGTKFTNYLIEENKSVFQPGGSRTHSPHWDYIENIMRNALKVDDQGVRKISHVSTKSFYSLLEFIVDVVLATTYTLVDRVWYLFVDVFARYIADHAQTIDANKVEELFRRLPWSKATVHLYDPNMLATLALLPEVHLAVQRLVFTQLDWIEFANSINAPNQTYTQVQTKPLSQQPNLLVDLGVEETNSTSAGSTTDTSSTATAEVSYHGRGVVYFLRLFLETNIDSPDLIPDIVRTRVLSVSTEPSTWYQDGRYLFLWQKIPVEDFITAFSGDSVLLKSIVTASKVTNDPTKHVMENVTLLRDVARVIGSPEVISVVMREIRSIMFVCVSSIELEGHYWYLPAQQHIDIVNTIMIPLAQQFHHIQLRNHEEKLEAGQHLYSMTSYEPLAVLFSCVKGRPGLVTSWDWGQPYLAPIKFFNSRTIPRCIVESEQIAEPTEIVAMKKDQQKQLQQLNEIIYGIVSRFCVSADPELCLSIMNQAHKGIDHNLPLLMHIFEETLHSFFVHTTHSDALDAAARAVDMSASVSWNALVQACLDSKTPLSLRVLLEQQRNYVDNFQPFEWMAFMTTTIPAIISFRPQLHHEFDLLCLWFFVLEIVDDKRWVPTTPAAHQLMNDVLLHWQVWGNDPLTLSQRLTYHSNMYMPESSEPNMQLAARACSLFLRRILQSHSKMFTATGQIKPVDLSAELDRLLSLRTNPKYSRYSDFFNQMESILSPVFDITSFQISIVNQLAPIAPYLLRFVRPPSSIVTQQYTAQEQEDTERNPM